MVSISVLKVVQKRRRGRRRSTTANRIPDGRLFIFFVDVVLPLVLLAQLFEVPPILVLVSAGWVMHPVNTVQRTQQRELHHHQLNRTRRRPTISCNLRPTKKNNIDKPSSRSNSAAVTTSQTIRAATHDTALAVVPPDEAWDRLQRARFLAQDGSYTVWPPAIRLFHPFVTSPAVLHERALQVARIVEDYDVTRFPITLSEWSIVPHEEALQAYHFLQQQQQFFDDDDDENTRSTRNSQGNDSEQSQDIQALIESEERIGREKYAQRQRRLGRKPRNPDQAVTDPDSNSTIVSVAPTKSAPQPRLDKEQRQYEQQQATQHEFNGPCVLCLEPDEASREQLQALRYLLRCELPDAEHYAEEYSPSGSMPLSENTATRPLLTPPSLLAATTPTRHHHHERRRPRRRSNKNDPATFRPLVPIAAFDTVSRAIPVARRLRRLWEPLTFNVTDLQFMAYVASTEATATTTRGSSTRRADTTTAAAADSSWGGDRVDYAASTASTSNGQFVCEALVYLVGEEEISMVEEEELLNREMAQWVWEQGLPGGHVVNKNNHNSTGSKDPIQRRPATWDLGIQLEENRLDDNDSAKEEEQELGMRSELEEWLLADDEDEDDEGAVVVLGRTHFFTGGMRHYVGMPASSTLDRLRSGSSSGGAGDSATARRRGSTPATAFEDGDFGTR